MATPIMRRSSTIATLVAIFLTVPTVQSASAADNKSIFDDKPLKLIVGMPVGGGIDAYARLVQRHLVNFLPGSPTIIVQNMPGAGSFRSVVATLNSPPDEVVLNTFSSSLITQAISEPERLKVDFRRFAFIGNVAEDSRLCFVRSALGLNTIADIVKSPNEINFGATAPGTSGNLDAAVLQKLFAVKLRQVRGYVGSAEKRIALERGEIDGDCAGITSIPEDWIKNHRIKMFVRMSPTPVPGVDASVPYAGDLLDGATDREVFRFLVAPQQLGRLFMTTDRTPVPRIAALRKAFDAMVVDARFLDDARHMNLLVTPMAGDDVNRRVRELYSVSPDVLHKAREVTRD